MHLDIRYIHKNHVSEKTKTSYHLGCREYIVHMPTSYFHLHGNFQGGHVRIYIWTKPLIQCAEIL